MGFSTAIQSAVFSRLKNYSPLTAIIKAVYDDVPQPADSGKLATFPYVVIGDDSIVEWDTDTELGADATVTIHIWSRAKGRKEVKAITDVIYNALHRYDIIVTGYSLVGVDWVSAQSFLDADGITRHGIAVFRITIEG